MLRRRCVDASTHSSSTSSCSCLPATTKPNQARSRTQANTFEGFEEERDCDSVRAELSLLVSLLLSAPIPPQSLCIESILFFRLH
jgi:hypothetical protein